MIVSPKFFRIPKMLIYFGTEGVMNITPVMMEKWPCQLFSL